ncbi:probable cyclic nucleotide-gated ion channel 16 [Olea europaea subsp. europaea]|uniref:Probable cyclic nucleotide-gated ion channel 16 n=1 Tax=Olea europaea subsp. europaea TaxID=158383 RepID=A0A8S0SBB5_OLEEU|nr:probable cyclic nucleotide-gated ion channel 16 [Olea europaea subsp. europaea]
MSMMNNFHRESTKLLQHLPLPKPSSLIYGNNQPWWCQILDPNGEIVTKWNQIFLVTSLIALFVDPLFFYLPNIRAESCMYTDFALAIIVILVRSIVDLFSALQILMKFRTSYVATSSRVFGKGELVRDPRKIVIRYLKTDFVIDLAAALPLPQFVVYLAMPLVRTHTRSAAHTNHAISLVIILQYVPRLVVIFPLNSRIVKNTGVVAKTAWSGAAYNLLLYMLASHVLGAAWYLMSVERHFSCWKQQCRKEQHGRTPCSIQYFDCLHFPDARTVAWLNSTKVYRNCNARIKSTDFDFGMFADAFKDQVTSADFVDKYFYCLWWGLKNLSSYGQGLNTTTYVIETIFSSLICLMGLVFFSLLIGNMQTYLQSMSARLEEWRIRRRDTEEWMRHRQLPPDLQDRIRRFVQYKWLATKGVEEEDILQSLPLDLRRQIQSHLCLSLVRRVPFFSQMDDQLLDAICERLVSSLNTKDTYIVREGDPVNEMLFIIRGQLESSTTNGGRSGFFNSITLKPGDFCGEELLTWALMPASNVNLPASTRTVKSITEVEAFALRSEDLKFVANQFKRLHSKKLQHAFRYYSHQWRTWGACYMQAAWRRWKRRKLADELARQESLYYMQWPEDEDEDEDEYADKQESKASENAQQLGATILASKFAANTRRGAAQKVTFVEPNDSSLRLPQIFKPDEPDFS